MSEQGTNSGQRRPKGRLIVLEGIDGSGTTTQARRLVETLWSRGESALLTREPSDGPIGMLLRQVLTGRMVARAGDGRPEPIDTATVALMFAADRLDHLQSEIEPSLEAGSYVVSDRYVLSSLAYQSLDNDLEWIRAINAHARTPDLTVFLSVEPALALGRRASTRAFEERFEALALQEKIASSYERLIAEGLGLGEAVVVDGAREPGLVAELILGHVLALEEPA